MKKVLILGLLSAFYTVNSYAIWDSKCPSAWDSCPSTFNGASETEVALCKKNIAECRLNEVLSKSAGSKADKERAVSIQKETEEIEKQIREIEAGQKNN